jgi:hypothetical protein
MLKTQHYRLIPMAESRCRHPLMAMSNLTVVECITQTQLKEEDDCQQWPLDMINYEMRRKGKGWLWVHFGSE